MEGRAEQIPQVVEDDTLPHKRGRRGGSYAEGEESAPQPVPQLEAGDDKTKPPKNDFIPPHIRLKDKY